MYVHPKKLFGQRFLSAITLIAMVLGMISLSPVQVVLAADQYLTGSAVDGNLKILVKDTGTMGVWRYVSGGWQRQIYAETSKGSRLYYNGSAYSLAKEGTWVMVGDNPTLVSNTTSGNTITTVWNAGSNFQITQKTTYNDGNSYYRLEWNIKNTSGATINDLRFFHGEDTFLQGGDNGAGWWDAVNKTVGVEKSVGGVLQRMYLQGITAPHAYDTMDYDRVRDNANAGALSNTVDPNVITDNGYALEWRKGSLAAGETWTIIAFERFTSGTAGSVNVIAPVSTDCNVGTSCDVTYQVSNPGGSAVEVNLSVSSDRPTWNPTITSHTNPVNVPAHGSISVVVRVSPPAGTPNGTVGNFTLTATPTGGGSAASDTAAVRAVRAPDTTVQIDFSGAFNADVVENTGDPEEGEFDPTGARMVTQAVAEAHVPGDDDKGMNNNGVYPANSEHPEVVLIATDNFHGYNAWKAYGILTATFAVSPTGQYNEVHIFASAGGAGPTTPARFRLTMHYTDGSSTTSSEITVPDWFGNVSAPGYYLIDGMDRFRNPDYQDADTAAIFGFPLLANPNKTLESINIEITDNLAGSFVFFGATATTASTVDTDGDGISDGDDIDDDNDGIPDSVEIANAPASGDTDGDGIPDQRDLDSDNDGINDVREAGGTDANGDGRHDGTQGELTNPPDTDGDGQEDYIDLDSDNDSVSDLVEGGSGAIDANNDGVADGPDADGDGIVDSADDNDALFGENNDPAPRNTDGDGNPDYLDRDSDGDGTDDIDEAGNGDLDANNDGRIDDATDADHDGIADVVDADDTRFGGLRVDTIAPAAPIVTLPISGTVIYTNRPTFAGTGEPGAVIKVYDGSTVVCTATVDPSGNWTCTPSTALGEGEKTFQVTQTDAAGNESNPTPVTVTIVVAPNFSINVTELTSIQPPNVVTTQTFQICNNGLLPLTYTINVGSLVGPLMAQHMPFDVAAPAVPAQPAEVTINEVTINETFMNSTAPGWSILGHAYLTSGGVDPVGQGWLRLTDNTGNRAGTAIYNTAFASTDGISVTFQYATYGGTGADGFTFYLIDGATVSPTVGAPGGSLGYSYNQDSPVAPGVTNGYVGIGFDEYGNFSNNRYGGCDPSCPGRQPNRVAIRGSGNLNTGFNFLINAPATIQTGSRAGAHTVNIEIVDQKITVRMDSGSGFVTYIDHYDLRTARGQITPTPYTFKMGFSASTGGSTNYHEIRNLVVRSIKTSSVTTLVAAPNPVDVGQMINFTATVSAAGGTPTGIVTFLDGSTVLGTGTLAGGVATFSTDALAKGTHIITARYEGDPDFGISLDQVTILVEGNWLDTRPASGTLQPGECAEIAVDFDSTGLEPGVYTSTLQIATNDPDTPLFELPIELTVLQPGQTLVIDKRAIDLNGSPLYTGDTIEYRVVVKNVTTTVQTNVVITDAIPTHTTYVPGSASVTQGSVSGPDPLVANMGSLAAGEQAVLTFRVRVNGDAVGQTVGNLASADSDQQEPPISVGPIYPQPHPGPVQLGPQALGIDKIAIDLNGYPLYVGDEIEYRVVVENLLSTAQTNVVITDVIPAHTTYVAGSASVTQGSIVSTNPVVANVGTLAAGAQAVLTFRVTVNSDAAGQTVINQALASSDTQKPPVETLPVKPYPDPIKDFPKRPGGGGPVLSAPQALGIAKTAVDLNGVPLRTGDEISYVITVTNLLPTAQTNVVITDAIPAHTTYVAGSASVTQGSIVSTNPVVANVGTLAAGAQAVLTFRVTVNSGAARKTITNQALASSNTQKPPAMTPPVQPYPDPIQDFPKKPGGGRVVTDNAPVAQDDTFAVPESMPAQPSSTLNVLANDSDADDDPLIITQVSAPAHGTATTNGATIVYTPTAGYLGVDTFTYTISDGDLQDTAQVTVTVSPVADLAVTQTARGTLSGMEFVIVARNLGPRDAPGAVVSDTFPAVLSNITWTCVASGGATCGASSGSGNLLTDTLTSFPVGGVVTYTVSAVQTGSQISQNIVTITPPAGVFDLNMDNNSATRQTLYRLILPVVLKNSRP